MKIGRKQILFLLLGLLIGTFLVLYFMFLFHDFGTHYLKSPKMVKYGIVIASGIFTLSQFMFGKSKESIFSAISLTLAMALTLVSDYFLLVSNTDYEIGVTIFTFAQLFHFVRTLFEFDRKKLDIFISLGFRILLPIIGIIIINLAVPEYFTYLYCIIIVYFTQLIANFLDAVYLSIKLKETKNRITGIILALGFLLFIICDIYVGLANIGAAGYEMNWIFYAPSQVLIASSFAIKYLYEK